MSINENTLKDKDGNVVCYLQEPKNGGIDLYDEYNKGIDKIVCKFKECADKLGEVEKAKEGKEEALERNEKDKRDKISALTAEKGDIEQQINDAEAEQTQEISDREREYEDKNRELDRAYSDKQDRLKQQLTMEEKDSAVKAYAACIAEKRDCEGDIENAYNTAKSDLWKTLDRLTKEIGDCEMKGSQISGDVSRLGGERGHILSDAEIQSEVDRYEKDPTNYNAAWNKFYQNYGNGQLFEQERELKEKYVKINRENSQPMSAREMMSGIFPTNIMSPYNIIRNVKANKRILQQKKEEASCVLDEFLQLSDENQRELERLQKIFQAEMWPKAVEAMKETLLSERAWYLKWNEDIDQIISDKESELHHVEDIRRLLVARYDELLEKWLPQLEAEKEKFHALCKQRLDEDINKLKAYIRTPDLRERYGASGEAEMEQKVLNGNIIEESGAASYMTRLPAYGELRISRIDWYQVTLEELPEMLGQAEKELGDWAEKLRHDAEAKERECAEIFAAADASAEAKMRTTQDEYDKKKAEADETFAADKEKIVSEYRRRIDEWNAEKEEIDSNIKKQENHYQEKGEELRAEWDEKIKELNDEYRKEMDIRLEQLEKNGMADICGFNYQQAWMHFHGLATNTMGFPANLKMYNKDFFAGLTAKAYGVDHEHCEFLPKHFMWGYYPVEEEGLPHEIVEEIANSLRKSGQMQIPRGWDSGDEEYYHVESSPMDTFYKLSHTPMKDGPAMIVYDLGNLDVDTQRRNLLMDFILRTFVFSVWQCVGNADHLRFHIISMQYEEYFSSYNDQGLLKNKKKLQVYSEKSDVRKVIEELRKSRDELNLGTSETLFSRNRERSRNGRNPSADYEVLVVVNTNYSELEDTDLRALLQASARKENGMNSFLLVDVDMLRQMDDSAGGRTAEAIQKFANDIESDDRFYELDLDRNASGDGTKFQIKPSSKNAVMAAIEDGIAGVHRRIAIPERK